MDITTFLTERIADDLAGLGETVTPQRRREALAKYKILELHQKWPVLVETPQELEVIKDFDISNTNQFTMRAYKQIEWMTNQEYIKKFGTEPPTTPIVLALAAIYCDHPDYDPEWVQV